MRYLATLVFLGISSASAQEYKPYPLAKITLEEWQTYFDEVKSKQGPSERAFPKENLVVYHSGAGAMNWAFTTVGHPAHPAWITRRVVTRDGLASVDQIGYFVSDEGKFAALFESYMKLNERTIKSVKDNESK